MSRTYFFTNQIFRKSNDPTWHTRYLANKEDRFTHILRNELANPYWENYSKQLTEFTHTRRLLFRAKSVIGENVELRQIWRSETDVKDFVSLANGELRPTKMLEKYGFHVDDRRSSITSFEVEGIIEQALRYPYILQVIELNWKKPGMVIGDPLKKNHSLPFP